MIQALYNFYIMGESPFMSNEEKKAKDSSEGSSELEGVEAQNGLKSEEVFVEKQLEVLTWLVRSPWRIKIFEEDEEDLPGTTLRIYRDAENDGYTDLDGEFIQRISTGFNPESYEITFSESDKEVWITFRDVDVIEVEQ